MILSLGLIFLLGMLFSMGAQRLKLPGLLGMIIAGILIGPFGLHLLEKDFLAVSADLRQIALVIILLRAGLNMDLQALKKSGLSALWICFVPACLEILGMVILAPPLLGLTVIESLLLGSVIAAVSPAVIVPRMLKLIEEGYGTQKGIPQLVMTGASLDDIFVIVLFTVFLDFNKTGAIATKDFLAIPFSAISGVLLGAVIGCGLVIVFRKMHMRDTVKTVFILGISFFLIVLEESLKGYVGFSGLLAIVAMGLIIKIKKQEVAVRLSQKFSKLWIGAELILFVLIGAQLNIDYAFGMGIKVIWLLLGVLVFRAMGVWLSLLKTNLNRKEKAFIVISYLPKATVQAAIGSIPLMAGLACGNAILTVAVVSILLTAPLGAWGIDSLYKTILKKENP